METTTLTNYLCSLIDAKVNAALGALTSSNTDIRNKRVEEAYGKFISKLDLYIAEKIEEKRK